MNHIYVLDTSVLIHDPNFLHSFQDCEIVLPITILDELDKLKKSAGATGRNARVVIRMLNEICDRAPDINLGILLDNEVLLRIDADEHKEIGNSLYGDTRILGCAVHLKKSTTRDVIVVSRDINMKVRAQAMGLRGELYEKEESSTTDLYTGVSVIVDEVAGNDLQTLGQIFAPSYGHSLNPNEYVVFQDKEGKELARGKQIDADNIKLVKKSYPWQLSPRNKEQEFAIDALLDNKIPLVTLIGTAGAGKSLVALASALQLVLERKDYDKLLIYRPFQEMGKGVGYLKGDLSEKLEPWFEAIMDSFEVLFSATNGDKWKLNFETYKRKDKIRLEALTYIRGRSISNALILLDEAQNLSKEEMKAILTRVGDNTKLIATGDVSQIDAHGLDPVNNGLTYVVEKFRSSPLAAHITFTEGERSELATAAADLL